MDVVWLLIGLVFLAVLTVALFEAVMAEPGLEAVRVVREAIMLAIAVGGLVLFVLVIDEHLTIAWAVGTSVAGLGVGYGTTWAGGHTALSGIALVPRSKLYPIASLVAAIVLLIGSLGAWIQVIAVGLLGFYAAVAAGVGRYVYRYLAARRAATVFSAEVLIALNPACSGCGAPLGPTDSVCVTCGTERPRTCRACGATIAATSTACDSCGARTAPPTQVAADATWRRTCLVCATPLDADADYCPTCGVSATPACPQCGGPALPGEVDCPVCGIDLEVAEVAADDDADAAERARPTPLPDITTEPGPTQ